MVSIETLDNKDLDFLKDLACTLRDQPHDGNADPVFWGIRDYRNVDNPDGQYVVVLDDGDVIFDEYVDDIEVLKDYLLENINVSEEDLEGDLNDLIDIIELDGSLQIAHYDKVPYITDLTGCFLTKKAAQDHIDHNRHHYTKDAHTYAMTAWRNPEFEDLINIIKKIY